MKFVRHPLSGRVRSLADGVCTLPTGLSTARVHKFACKPPEKKNRADARSGRYVNTGQYASGRPDLSQVQKGGDVSSLRLLCRRVVCAARGVYPFYLYGTGPFS